MARKPKVGIDYFSHDVDMLNDRKIKLLKAKHGLIGYAIYLRLLEDLYRDEGYYLKRNEEFDFLFANDNNIDIDVYINVINECINQELFNSNIHNAYNVLTSKRIQYNYLDACKRRKEVSLIKEYLLVNPSDVYGNDYKINVNINSIDVDISTQSKEEKSILEKSIKEKNKEGSDLRPVVTDLNEVEDVDLKPKKENPLADRSDSFQKVFSWFKEMRIKMKSPMTTRAIKLLLTELDKLSTDETTQIAIMEQSIMNGWKSVYALKGNNGKPMKPDVEVEWLDDYIKKFKEENK